MSRALAVLAMASALLAATPLAANAAAPPAAGVAPAVECSFIPPPAGFSYQSSHNSCQECQVAAFRWEMAEWRTHCQLFPSSGRVDLYIAPPVPADSLR